MLPIVKGLNQLLQRKGFILLDGGLATELENRDHDLNNHLWSAGILQSHPGDIRDVHLDYLRAGSDCIVTSTYQASIPGFIASGFSKTEAEDLIKLSVSLAFEARDIYLASSYKHMFKPLVAASIGPYGAYLADGAEYRGNYGVSFEALKEFHQSRWEILAKTNVELFACETIPSLGEAQVLRELLKETPQICAWISFSCKDELHINDGAPIYEAAQIFEDTHNVVAVGVNCTAPQYVTSLIQQIRKAIPSREILCYPNTGAVYNAESKTWKRFADPMDFAASSKHWFRTGARFIGGCCLTGPDHIKAIKASLEEVLSTEAE